MTRTIKSIIISIIFIFQQSKSFGEVLIRPFQSAIYEYEAYVEIHNKYETYIDFFKKNIPSEEHKKNLSEKFKIAQESYLENKNSSVSLFMNLINDIHLTDWNDTEKEVLFYSLIRLAELDRDNLNKWLTMAIQFHPSGFIDRFSPSMKLSFIELKSKLKKSEIKWSPNDSFLGYDLIIIDGERFPLERDLEIILSGGVHRVSLVSNSHPYWSQIMDQNEILKIRVNNPPIISGECKNFELNSHPFGVVQYTLWFSSHCVQSVSSQLNLKNSEKVVFPNGVNMNKINDNSDKYMEKVKLWSIVGVSVFVLSLFIYSKSPMQIKKTKRIVKKANQENSILNFEF